MIEVAYESDDVYYKCFLRVADTNQIKHTGTDSNNIVNPEEIEVSNHVYH